MQDCRGPRFGESLGPLFGIHDAQGLETEARAFWNVSDRASQTMA